jgi:hypothetical protein
MFYGIEGAKFSKILRSFQKTPFGNLLITKMLDLAGRDASNAGTRALPTNERKERIQDRAVSRNRGRLAAQSLQPSCEEIFRGLEIASLAQTGL